MKVKRYLIFLVFALCLFTIAANGKNEIGYLQIGSQSDDPFVSMKVLTYKDLYADALATTQFLQLEEAGDALLLRYADEIAAYYAMEPEIWETDELFEERMDKEYQQINKAIVAEAERIVSNLLASAEQQVELLDGFAAAASVNLSRSRPLANSTLRIQSKAYDRNARVWALSVSSDDKQVPFVGISLEIDFTSIGDEKTIREEIIKFEEAIRKDVLKASVGWHFIHDLYDDRFLLVIDFLGITNPLTGGSYTLDLEEPILIKTYFVTGTTIETLEVTETTQNLTLGIDNLSYWDRAENPHTLNSQSKTLILDWNRERQEDKLSEASGLGRMESPNLAYKAKVAKPSTPAAPVASNDAGTSGPVVAQEESKATDAQAEEKKGPMVPNLPLTRLDGTVTSVSDVRGGKPAIINYFASWCQPCKQELPHFQKAFDEYGEEVSFIFLDALDGQRETLKTINAFIKSFPFTAPVFYDDGMFATVFQTNSLPTTVFLDKEGRVVNGYLGFVPEEALYKAIAELLD